MGNAFKQLRHSVVNSPIEASEEDTKKRLCDIIDRYIDSSVVVAQDLIAVHGGEKLNSDDIILTFSYYTAVKKVSKFKSFVVSSR